MKPSYYFLLSLVVFLACHLNIVIQLDAQQVISQLEIERGAWNDGYEYIVRDYKGNLFVGLVNHTANEGFVIGDTMVYASRLDTPAFQLSLSDFYLFRFNPSHELTGSFTIDNSELVLDYCSNGNNSFISYQLYQDYGQVDSMYPINLNGELEISREDYRGKGLLIVLDDSMQLDTVLIPSTGELGQIAVDGEYLYIELGIPDRSPFITIGEDTVYNYYRIFQNDTIYSNRTIVLCKYDLDNHEIVWRKRIGGGGTDELLNLQIDTLGDIILSGKTSSTRLYFTPFDTAFNSEVDKPFIGKYSSDGTFQWGKLNENQPLEWFLGTTIDNMNNVYQFGQQCFDEYFIGDTILYNEPYNNLYPCRGIIIKYDQDGEFKWASQLEGGFKQSVISGLAASNSGIIAGGIFSEGKIKFGNIEYYNNSLDSNSVFLYKINPVNGHYISHIMTEGESNRIFHDLYFDANGNLNMYMLFAGEGTYFGEYFSSILGYLSGFLVKLTTDFPSSTFDVSRQNISFDPYPNPAKPGEPVFLDLASRFGNGQIHYTVMNAAGQSVFHGEGDSEHSVLKAPLPDLPSGIYLLEVRQGEKRGIGKFIVEE